MSNGKILGTLNSPVETRSGVWELNDYGLYNQYLATDLPVILKSAFASTEVSASSLTFSITGSGLSNATYIIAVMGQSDGTLTTCSINGNTATQLYATKQGSFDVGAFFRYRGSLSTQLSITFSTLGYRSAAIVWELNDPGNKLSTLRTGVLNYGSSSSLTVETLFYPAFFLFNSSISSTLSGLDSTHRYQPFDVEAFFMGGGVIANTGTSATMSYTNSTSRTLAMGISF